MEKLFTNQCICFLQIEVAAALQAATATPTHHHLAEDENDDELCNGENGDVSHDLDIDEHIKDPVEDRRTLAERSERLHDQLKVGGLLWLMWLLNFY